MRILQLSLSHCPPCKRAIQYFESLGRDVGHEVQQMDKEHSEEAKELMLLLNTKSAPHFVVLSSDEQPKIIDNFVGYNQNKISEYIYNYDNNNGVLKVDGLEIEEDSDIIEDAIIEDSTEEE